MRPERWDKASDEQRLHWLAQALSAVVQQMRDLERRLMPRLTAVEPRWRASALNLAHYVALRLEDLRELQARLAELGLSSLGRSEPGVLSNVEAVRGVVARLSGRVHDAAAGSAPTSAEGRRLLAAHADALFGPPRNGHAVRVMVTMPSEAALEPQLVHALVAAGMDVMRINCAHDDPDAWRRMAAALRAANAALGTACRVQLDLPGPKLRTGAFEPGPNVLHLSPQRGALGEVLQPARVRLKPSGSPGLGLTVPRAFFEKLEAGGRIGFVDSPGRRRSLDVVSVDPDGAWAVSSKGAWLTPKTVLTVAGCSAALLDVPAQPGSVHLKPGDRVLLCGPSVLGRAGVLGEPALVPCTMPAALTSLRRGHHVWFDDGKLGGVVEELDGARALVRLTGGRPKGLRLRADRGINLPDSNLEVPALGPDDFAVLDVACEVGDLVALSFCHSAHDVLALHEQLEARRSKLGVVLKVENRAAFESLPSLLLAAMRRPPFGVMIARGDLAVECGFARLAELQEEMLCLCEAAHAPVIWATQVLETAARKGFPSRAEVTDAAVGERAECVMLNKGPYVLQAVKTLEDILSRMKSHQRKKTPLFRRLESFGRAPPISHDG